MIYKFIFNYFGEAKQKFKLEEECKEFIESYCDEEIADVFILAMQFYKNKKTVRDWVKFKLKRTKKRIKDGYYGGKYAKKDKYL